MYYRRSIVPFEYSSMSVSLKSQKVLQRIASEVSSLANSTEEQRVIARLQKENLLLTKAVITYLREAEVARGQLKQFASRVSHDLKAPLRHIASYLTIIKEDFLNGRVEDGTLKYMETVSNSAVKMGKMIDALRELTQTEEQPVLLTEVDLGRELSFALKQINHKYPGIRYELPELPVIESDLAMIRTVLDQVLGNAAKFSSKETDPKITVSCCRSGAYWEIAIADNGVGFDARDGYLLFEIFERCATGREFQGQGIGLSIVAGLMKRLKGNISGEGVAGEGAVFTLRLKA